MAKLIARLNQKHDLNHIQDRIVVLFLLNSLLNMYYPHQNI